MSSRGSSDHRSGRGRGAWSVGVGLRPRPRQRRKLLSDKRADLAQASCIRALLGNSRAPRRQPKAPAVDNFDWLPVV